MKHNHVEDSNPIIDIGSWLLIPDEMMIAYENFCDERIKAVLSLNKHRGSEVNLRKENQRQ